MKNLTKSFVCLFMLLALALSFVGCGGFSFRYSDLAPYVSFGDADWRDLNLSVTEVPEVTDEDVSKEFNSYFAEGKYYLPVAEEGRTVANGDTVYLHYVGILSSALEKAVTDGKITDASCTGLTLSEIRDLDIGFQGGSTSTLTSFKIGSNSYIEGFESGLVGVLPSTENMDTPYPLRLTFPTNYSNSGLAGKSVVFFCSVIYIADMPDADKSPTHTAETLTAEMVNIILGLEGENAYPDLEACMKKIREGLESERESELRTAKQTALWQELVKKANVTLTDEISEAYINSYLADRLADLQYLYENNPSYYYYYLGTTSAPTMTLLVQYLGYSADNYMDAMKTDSADAVKQELVFWYLVRSENMLLSDEEVEAKKNEYIKDYGENVFDGYSDEAIYQQFLFDAFNEQTLKYLEDNGRITYTPAEEAE